jgi:hypothetical protein
MNHGPRLQIAKRQAVVNPENTFFSVKRFIGRKMEEVKDESKQVPYQVSPSSLAHPSAGQATVTALLQLKAAAARVGASLVQTCTARACGITRGTAACQGAEKQQVFGRRSQPKPSSVGHNLVHQSLPQH